MFPRILTSSDFPLREAWTKRADVISPGSAMMLARRLVTLAADYDAVVLTGSRRAEQAATMTLRLVRPGMPVVLEDATWRLGKTSVDRIASRVAVRMLAGPSTHFCVLTAAEFKMFPRTWGVPPERVHLTPWYHGLTDEQLSEPTIEGGWVFSGGDSMRDYRPLIEAARHVDAPVRIAALHPPPVDPSRFSTNLTYGPLPEDEYMKSMRDASVVVVALAGGTERSAGQNNYLNPMALGKLVIVTDGTGVREYIVHRETGLVVPSSDPIALEREIGWALDPANQAAARAIAERGRKAATERFSPERYVDRLIEVVEYAAGGTPSRGVTHARHRLAGRAKAVAGRSATQRLIRQTRRAAADVRLVLVYHGIRRAYEPPGLFPPELEVATFSEHLDHLRSNYAVVPLRELVDGRIEHAPDGRTPVALTFDDDLQSYVTLAAPLLREHQFPATFFLTGSSLGGEFNYWWRDIEALAAGEGDGWRAALDSLAEAWPWLSGASPADAAAAIINLPPADRDNVAAELRDLSAGTRSGAGISAAQIHGLAADGFEIGFHTLLHHPLHTLDDAALELAMREGIEDLTRAAGARPQSIAYPYGKGDLRIAHTAGAAGFKWGFLVGGDRAIRDDDPALLLPRIDIYSGSVSVEAFAFRLARIGYGAARRGDGR